MKTNEKDIDNILNDSKNEIIPINSFDYIGKKVRTIYRDGEIWFVAVDVSSVLGYAKPHNAISMHCKGSLKQGVLTEGGMQELIIIPESDVYRLIFRSKLPEAEKFENWVTKEVLPSIRKTGKYEIEKTRELSDDEKRFQMRTTQKQHNKKIHATLKEYASMNEKIEYAIWHNKGYQSLYELPTSVNATKQIAKNKNTVLNKGDSILDYMGIEELAIIMYHTTQSEAMIRQKQHTVDEANKITYDLGVAIVNEIKARGNRPPKDIPFVEHIKEVGKRLSVKNNEKNIENKNHVTLINKIISCDGLEYDENKVKYCAMELSKEIDTVDIWKLAIIFSYFKEDGIMLTSELLEIIPRYFNFAKEEKELSPSTQEPKYIQKIKNIKSNRNNATNPFYLGYFEDIKDGFKITPKGIDFIKSYFKEYLK